MRKQNHSIPPALKRDARLINSVIRSRKYKRLEAVPPHKSLKLAHCAFGFPEPERRRLVNAHPQELVNRPYTLSNTRTGSIGAL
jgi:hypothetical protein